MSEGAVRTIWEGSTSFEGARDGRKWGPPKLLLLLPGGKLASERQTALREIPGTARDTGRRKRAGSVVEEANTEEGRRGRRKARAHHTPES